MGLAQLAADGMTLRTTSFRRAGSSGDMPFDIVVLDADARHIRRGRLTLQHGDKVLVDFKAAAKLERGDLLVLDDGRMAEVIAAEEGLLEVTGRNAAHLLHLAWSIGNQHLPAQIEDARILVRRGGAIRQILESLGAAVQDVMEPFHPEQGTDHPPQA